MPMRPSKSGLVVCGALLAMGIMVWAGFEAARRAIDTSPANGISPGIPGHAVSVIACDINRDKTVVDQLVSELAADRSAAHTPDFVLLQRVDQTDMNRLAAAMGIATGKSNGGDTILFDISINAEATDGAWGNAILSKVPLYEGRAIPNEGGGSIGVWAACVMDAKRFRIASVDLVEGSGDEVNRSRDLEIDHFRQAWKAAGDEPMILGMVAGEKSPIDSSRQSGDERLEPERLEISTPWEMGAEMTAATAPIFRIRAIVGT